MEEINLKDFFNYLKSYILVFAITIAVAVSGVVIYEKGFKQPVYQAQTTVVIAKADGLSDNSAASLNDVNASQKLVATYGEIAKSELVLKQVISNLGLHYSVKELSKNATIKPVDNTAILSISVKDLNARLSAMIANEIAEVFAAEVTEIYKVENVTQLSIAATPESPSNNTFTRDLVLAVVIAAALVCAVAFLRFYFDDTIKDSDDTEKALGLPVTGRILKSDAKIVKGTASELITENSPKAIVSENIKSLRTNLQFTAVDKELRSILITSTNASEGKSFVSSNLAVSFAQADKRVLLVDCDLRKGRLHKIFGVPNMGGLSNLLAGDVRNFAKYVKRTRTKNLEIITCGTYPPNPSELLSSRKNERLVQTLCQFYDIVIFDGAPVGGLADSVILSSLVDETLIVVKEGTTNKSDVIAAKDALEKVGANIAGLVFNMTSHRAAKYYNNYYYGETKK